jgi:hypothetical protein
LLRRRLAGLANASDLLVDHRDFRSERREGDFADRLETKFTRTSPANPFNLARDADKRLRRQIEDLEFGSY